MSPLTRPPRALEAFLRSVLPGGVDGDTILGDLREEYSAHRAKSVLRALLWYLVQLILITGAYGPGSLVRLLGPLGGLQIAFRGMARAPGFTASVVMTVALAIGLGAAVFSAADAVLFRSLPFDEPDELVRIWAWETESDSRFVESTYPDIAAFRETSVFEAVAGMSLMTRPLIDGTADPVSTTVIRTSPEFFGLLGIQPLLGRMPDAEDRRSGRSVVAISEALWRTRFGTDPDVLGREIDLLDDRFTVVGVIPSALAYPEAGDVWRLLTLDEIEDDDREVELIARLRGDVTEEQVQAEVTRIAAGLAAARPSSHGGHTAWVQPMHAMLVKDARTPLLLFLAAAASILLIACLNVSNLFLARALSRTRMVAVRAALGASRRRLAAEQVLETLSYVALGGVLGLGIGRVALDVMAGIMPDMPRVGEAALDLRVVVVVGLVTLVTGMTVGLLPTVQTLQADPNRALRGEGSSHRSRSRKSVRRVIVIAEVALATALTVTGVLLTRSLQNSLATDWGFDSARLVWMIINPIDHRESDDEERAFLDGFEASLTAVPGVLGVTVASHDVLEPRGFRLPVDVIGAPARDNPDREASLRAVSPGFWETTGAELLTGRPLDARDGPDGLSSIVVNERFVDELIPPGEEPIGTRVGVLGGEWEVVGVAGDIRTDADHPAQTLMYFPLSRFPQLGFRALVRTTVEPAELIPSLKSAAWSVDPTLPLDQVGVVEDAIAARVAGPRFNMIVVGVFAALALALSATGVYGVLMFEVNSRRDEIGIRRALGAGRERVTRWVLGDALKLGAYGLLAGILLSVWASRAIESLLFGVTASHWQSYVPAVLILCAVGFVATWMPLRSALKVQPVEALKG